MSDFSPHSIKQDQALFGHIEHGYRLTICGTGIQWGKGLPNEEQVLTPTGYRAVGEIKHGDTLYDRFGKPTKVIGVFPQGVMPCFEISFTDGKSLTTDASHLNVIIARPGRPERIISTANLFAQKHLWGAKRRGAGKARVPAAKPVELPAHKFLISPYIMGALLGDGGLTSSVILSSPDQEIIARVAAELPKGISIKKKACEGVDYKITTDERQTTKEGYGFNPIIAELRRLCLFGCHSAYKFIPNEYRFASIEQRLDLLRGLMDTDGYALKNKTMQFYSVSKELAEGVIWLVESLGGKAWSALKAKPTYRHNGEKRIGQPCYLVSIICPHFNPFFVKRKADQYFVHENTPDKVICDVRPVGERHTICFKVDSPSETFIARGQVVTHNTLVGCHWLRNLMLMRGDPHANYIVTSPSFRILGQSTLPPFQRVMEDLGTLRRGDMNFPTSFGTVWFRTATDPDSVVGLTNVRGILCDESGLYPLYFWENIQGRAAPLEAPIMIVTSPYSQNWLYRDYVRHLERDPNSLPEEMALLIQARSNENPFFSSKEYLRKQKTMDPRRFKMMFGGEFGRMEGLVYDCFDDDENMCPQTTILPPGTVFYAGVDWGVTHAFVIHVRAVTPSGDHYQVAETFSPGLNPMMMAQAAASAKLTWGIKTFYADPSQPGMIQLFNSKGIPCVAANNDIKVGIGYHYELIKTRRFKIFQKVAPHSIDQYSTYHYPSPKDLKQDQDEKAIKPVKVNDDALDAARYCTIMTYHLSEPKRRAGVPGEMGVDVNRLPHDEVIQIRKRANRRDRSERWS